MLYSKLSRMCLPENNDMLHIVHGHRIDMKACGFATKPKKDSARKSAWLPKDKPQTRLSSAAGAPAGFCQSSHELGFGTHTHMQQSFCDPKPPQWLSHPATTSAASILTLEELLDTLDSDTNTCLHARCLKLWVSKPFNSDDSQNTLCF